MHPKKFLRLQLATCTGKHHIGYSRVGAEEIALMILMSQYEISLLSMLQRNRSLHSHHNVGMRGVTLVRI